MSNDPRDEAVARLDDDEVRERVSTRDFSDFEDLALDDDEREALVQLADDFPEVAGFAMDAFTKALGGINLGASFFNPLSTAHQVSEVKVRAWDPAHHKDIVGRPPK